MIKYENTVITMISITKNTNKTNCNNYLNTWFIS